MTSVLVIDDHPIVLQGCRRLLEDAGITSVLEAADAAAGYELFCRHRPDVVIVDLAMGKDSLAGLSLIHSINSHDPQAHILVLSMHRDPIIVAHALEAGASSYVFKDTGTEDLLNAIRAIQEGNSYLSHDLALQVATRTSSHGSPAKKAANSAAVPTKEADAKKNKHHTSRAGFNGGY